MTTAFLPRTVPRTPPASPVGVPLVSIVIVNYRQWANTARLVRQLNQSRMLARGIAEIVIVDNDSPPHPARARLRRTPGVSVRSLPRNFGFARGANEGCRLSRGQWFLLLNPDVTVASGFLARVLEFLDPSERESLDPRVGIVGLRSVDPSGSVQSSTGRDPCLLATLLGPLRPRRIRKGLPPTGTHRRAVPWVTGCGLLVRRTCYTQLGGFDPAFFLYYEDADLCRRARVAGWVVCHDPRLTVVHHHPLHSRPIPARVRLMTRHALLTYARKHWHPWMYMLLILVAGVEAWLRGWSSVRRVAIDLVVSGPDRAYRRVWRAAQQPTEGTRGQRRLPR